ncbi:MAG: FAD-dependent oxidoreductase [Gammaproteobacteria bacterium]|nr:MAG: FAD-dependent oxidoreductase [Gammaproteobacteria bacterium]
MGRLAEATLLLLVACTLAACDPEPMRTDADIIVVGAGIAGLSAALEASGAGADTRVILIETSSMPGGHAVQAGGFALVGTPLQEKKGHADSPEIAYRDLMAWGEDADPAWVRLFADRSRVDIHDWLTALGVNFNILLDTPETTVPRFHFAGGTAVNVIVPMLREAYGRKNLRFVMNARVDDLIDLDGAIGVRHRNTRTGKSGVLLAPSVILATGGFQSNLEVVRAHWPVALAAPERLLIGAGHNATGDGISIAQAYDVSLHRMDHQVTFINGLPNPRDPTRGLHVTNPAALWVDASGRRFVNEAADSKQTEAAGLALTPQTHWLIFDAQGRRKLRLRGAPWLNPKTIANEILGDPDTTHRADTIAALAVVAGLPAAALPATVDRYNRFVAAGRDEDFQRFPGADGVALTTPPYFAMQLFPMTRKSLGGLTIDLQGRVVDDTGQAIDGLYAAGELTGVAGINGSHGGSGTFLAPSVLTGRIAGASAATYAKTSNTVSRATWSVTSPLADTPANHTTGAVPLLTAGQLETLLAADRSGYWHFGRAHAVVLERKYTCTRCHTHGWPTGPATTTEQRLVQIESCTNCH